MRQAKVLTFPGLELVAEFEAGKLNNFLVQPKKGNGFKLSLEELTELNEWLNTEVLNKKPLTQVLAESRAEDKEIENRKFEKVGKDERKYRPSGKLAPRNRSTYPLLEEASRKSGESGGHESGAVRGQ